MTRKRWNSDSVGDQTDRVAVVTGGNSGIGYETAKVLANKGATVIVASRSNKRGSNAIETIREEHPQAKIELMLLDLASQASVKRFAKMFKDRFDRVDVLINNAGVMMPPVRQETEDGFELQLGTNHLGHFTLTLLLMDLLAATADSRVVNVSSSAQNFAKFDIDDLQWIKRSFDRMGSYGASKAANMLFTLELQRRFNEAGVSTIAAACHPGWTSTNLQKTSPLFRLLNPFMGMQPWQGALPTLYAAVADDVTPGGYYGPDGLGTLRGYPTTNKPSKLSMDAGLAMRLWSQSEELVNLHCPDLTAAAVTAVNE